MGWSHVSRVVGPRRTLPFLLALAAAGAPLTAQNGDAGEPQSVWRETVVVSASRFEQEGADVAANVTVLDEKDVAESAALVADDFLRQVPGFSLFRRTSSLVAHPTSQGVSLRGIGPSGVSRTLVLLDGIPLNDPFGGWVYWSRVPLERVEQVEVVRGGGSNVWGNFALGGVIQLITRDPSDHEGTFRLEGGNLGTVLADAGYSNRWGSNGLQIDASWFDTDGYYLLPPDQRGEIDVPASSQHFGGGVRYVADPSDRTHVSVRGDVFDEDRGNGTPLTNNDTQTDSLSVRVLRAGSGGGEWNFSVFGQDQEFASTFSSQAADRSTESPALDQFLVDSQGLGLGLQWTRTYGSQSGHVVTAGGELRNTDGDTNEDFFFSGDHFLWRRRAGGEQGLAGVFLQDTIAVGSNFQIQVGARGDRWESRDGFREERSLVTGIARLEETFGNRSETEISPRVSALYRSDGGLGVRASLYESFRAPTINELFRPFRVRNDITAANEELVPETLFGIEAGVDFSGSGPVRGKLTGFWNQVDDPIANVTIGQGPGVVSPCGFVPGGGVCRQRQNLDRTLIQGLEAEIEYRPTSRFRLSGSYLYSDTEVKEAASQPVLEGKRIAQVPENQLVARAGWVGRGGLDVSLQGRWVDDQFEDDLNTRVLDSYVSVDMAVSHPVGRQWVVFVRAENLLDEEIEAGETAEGLVTLGTPRMVHGGFRFRFRGGA